MAAEPSTPDLASEPLLVVNAVRALHFLRIPFYINGALILAAIIAGIVAIAYTEAAAFSSWGYWRVFLVPVLNVAVLVFAYFAWAHNLRRNTLALTTLVTGFNLFIHVVFAIWAIVDVVWYCPTELPDFCTNTITSTITTGYWIYAISLWIVTLLWIVDLIIISYARRTLRRATNRFSGIEQTALFELLWRNGSFPTNYVTAIGSQKSK